MVEGQIMAHFYHWTHWTNISLTQGGLWLLVFYPSESVSQSVSEDHGSMRLICRIISLKNITEKNINFYNL